MTTPTPDRLTVEQRRQFHPYPASSGNGPCPVCGKSVGDQVHSSRLAGNYALATPTPDRLRAVLADIRSFVAEEQAREGAGLHFAISQVRVLDYIDSVVAALATRPEPEEERLDRGAVKAVIEDNMERAYRNGHRQGYECGVEGATECEHVGLIDREAR